MKAAVITSSILILCLILLRKLCRGRISALVQYALWLIVAVRLIIPGIMFIFPNVLPKSDLSVMNAAEEIEERAQELLPSLPVQINLSLPAITGQADGPTSVFIAGKVGAGFWSSIFWRGGRGSWCLGMLVVGLWMFTVNIRFARKLHVGRKNSGMKEGGLPVYIVKDLASPCLYGMPGRQCIYLPEDVAVSVPEERKAGSITEDTARDKKLRHILVHEYCHYKHRDVFWALLRCILVIVYWFHPLVWVAAILSKRDCELACDEAAIRMLGEEERISYGKTLLELITRKSKVSDLACMATTMTAGGKSLKERIARIADNPGRVRVLLAAVLFFVTVLSVFTFTQAKDIPSGAYLLSGRTGMSVESECFYIDFPKTLDGKIWVEEENGTDIIVYDSDTGKEIGGFYRMGMIDAYSLAAKETIYPIGNYGGNSYLNSGNPDEEIYFEESVPGTDSNSDTSYPEIEDKETMYASGGGTEPIPAPEEVDNELINLPYTEDQSLDIAAEYVTTHEYTPYTEPSFGEAAENEADTYLPDEEIIVTQTPGAAITETYRYDMGVSELYLTDDGNAAVGVFCYLYCPVSYTDVDEKEAARLEQINQELIALAQSDSVQVLLMNTAAMEQILERMAEYRTLYVGEAFKVSQLVDSVPAAEGLLYRYMEMDTGQQPYGITIHCRMLTDNLADINQDVCLLDAILLFASVENLDQVTIAIAPEWGEKNGLVSAPDEAFITYYRSNQEERFGELYPCSETKEGMVELYQRVWDTLTEK